MGAQLVLQDQIADTQHALQAQMVTVQPSLQNQMVGAHYILTTCKNEFRGRHLDYAHHTLLDPTVGAHPILLAQAGAHHALLQV